MPRYTSTMSLEARCRTQKTLGLAAIALFMLLPSAFAANAQKASLQNVTQQFQLSTAVVITSARDFFANMNEVEQNGTIDDLAFERKPIDNVVINQIQIISPQELKVRTDAMNALSEYTLDLATLASGASLKTFGQNLQNLTKGLKQLSTDSGSLPEVPATSFLKNKSFPGIVSGAVAAIGAIVELIEGRKAQHEIEQQILANDNALTAITGAIDEELGLAYERERSNDSARVRDLTIEYNKSLAGPNVFLAVLIAHRVEASRSQMIALTNANPAKAVAAMQKAHAAMVQYVSSGKKSADLESLISAVGNFASAAQSSQAASPTGK